MINHNISLQASVAKIVVCVLAFTSCLAGMGMLTSATAASATSLTGQISAGQILTAPSTITSPDGRFVLAIQPDGNLVIYWSNGVPLWASNTGGHSSAPYLLAMQGDGNLVIYKPNAGGRLWASNTGGHSSAPYLLAMQSDGNLVIYKPYGGGALWASNTGGHPAAPPPLPAGGQAWKTVSGSFMNITYHATWNGSGVTTIDHVFCSPQTATIPVLNAGLTPEVPGQTAWCGASPNGTTNPVVGANFTMQANCGLLGLIPYTWLSCVIDPIKVNMQVRWTVGANGAPSLPGVAYWNSCGGLLTLYAPRMTNCFQ